MTDQELQQLAREYAEQNPPADIKDEVLKSNMIGLNAEIFEKFLVWLTKTHCIVSRDRVTGEHQAYALLSEKHPKASERHIAKAVATELERLFGTETFKTPKPIEQ